MTKSLYATSFSLKILDHLGINLYGNAPAVIAEMVANSHDAGARRVDITISPGKIVIQDDGVGMSLVDINTKYLRFGYEKRTEVTTIAVSEGPVTIQRHVMGRKGIGKISALSIANKLEVHTIHNTERNGFIIDLDAIRPLQQTNDTEYLPTPVSITDITITRGTRLELRDLVENMTGLDNSLRVSLARMFPVTGSEVLFDIYINGLPLNIKDRIWYEKIQFLWYFGQHSEYFTTYCPRLEQKFMANEIVELKRGYTISGWLATIFQPSDLPIDQKIVPVYAQNKMIQRDILYDFKNYKLSSAYIIGEVYAPFMDVDIEPDIVLTDRQRINPNDPRYTLLRQHVVDQVEIIDKSWNKLRGKSPNRRVRKKKTEDSKPSSEDNSQAKPSDTSAQPNPDTTSSDTDDSSSDQSNRDSSAVGSKDNTSPNTGPEAKDDGTAPNGQPGQDDRRRPPPPPAREAQTTFSNIRSAVEASVLEQEFKDIILYDLEQARLAYYNQAYKACVIMLGAVVEGLMLATLRRPEVIELMIKDLNPPASLNGMRGMRNAIYTDRSVFAQDLGTRLGFEEYRKTIQFYLPQSQHLGIVDVQRFRNAVHPWNCVQQPDVFGRYTAARALAHLASLEPLANFLLAWNP